MTDMVGAPSIGELDDDFDLDVRIDDIDPAEPDRVPLASFAMSCSMCCPGEAPTEILTDCWCATNYCYTYTCNTGCYCTGVACN
jgi:hypothetical protein